MFKMFCRFRVSRVRVCGFGLWPELRFFKLVLFSLQYFYDVYIIQLKAPKDTCHQQLYVKTLNSCAS